MWLDVTRWSRRYLDTILRHGVTMVWRIENETISRAPATVLPRCESHPRHRTQKTLHLYVSSFRLNSLPWQNIQRGDGVTRQKEEVVHRRRCNLLEIRKFQTIPGAVYREKFRRCLKLWRNVRTIMPAIPSPIERNLKFIILQSFERILVKAWVINLSCIRVFFV